MRLGKVPEFWKLCRLECLPSLANFHPVEIPNNCCGFEIRHVGGFGPGKSVTVTDLKSAFVADMAA